MLTLPPKVNLKLPPRLKVIKPLETDKVVTNTSTILSFEDSFKDNRVTNFIDINAWMNEPTVQNISKKKTRTKDVTYGFFLEMSKITEDEFWENKLSMAAYNKFPKNFKWQNNYLTFTKGSKVFRQQLSTNVYEARDQVINFFKEKGNICSPKDQQAMFVEKIKDEPPLTWISASKRTRECLIIYYCIEQKKLRNLDDYEYHQLRHILNGIVNNKRFDDRIVFEDKRIIEIKSLIFDPVKRYYYFENLPKVSRSSRKKDKRDDDDDNLIYSRWKKYNDCIDQHFKINNESVAKGLLAVNNKPRSLRQIYLDHCDNWLNNYAPVNTSVEKYVLSS